MTALILVEDLVNQVSKTVIKSNNHSAMVLTKM